MTHLDPTKIHCIIRATMSFVKTSRQSLKNISMSPQLLPITIRSPIIMSQTNYACQRKLLGMCIVLELQKIKTSTQPSTSILRATKSWKKMLGTHPSLEVRHAFEVDFIMVCIQQSTGSSKGYWIEG